MTPPAAAAAPRTRTRRQAPPPRRVSGPVRARSTGTTVASPPPLALRLGGAVHGLAEHRLLDRLVRGRAWIAILALGLMGIVFMQVSMLRMNAGITSAIEQAGTLERRNAALRAAISELSSGDRIATEAGKLGLVVPAVTARFLDARGADARRAVSSITAPGQRVVPSAVLAVPVAPAAPSATPVLETAGVAPATESATAPTDDAPASTTTPAEPAPAPEPEPAPAATTAPEPTPSTAAPPPADAASTGGVDATGQAG